MQRLQPTLMAPNITIARISDFESLNMTSFKMGFPSVTDHVRQRESQLLASIAESMYIPHRTQCDPNGHLLMVLDRLRCGFLWNGGI